MWNTIVSDLSTGLQSAFRPLAAMAHEYPMTTVGIVLLFALLAAMLIAQIADGGTTAARIDQVPPI